MTTAEMTFFVDASPERVFDALADHARFFRGKRITKSAVIRPGVHEQNGLGAVREVHNAGIRFVEEITRFERPVRFDYLVTECSLPLRHEGGVITFTPHGTGTEVRWTSRFTLAVPLVGKALSDVMRMILIDEITRLVHLVKRELEAPAA